jgi:O-antigen ligase
MPKPLRPFLIVCFDMDEQNSAQPTLAGYLVGIYLFTTTAFGFSDTLGLLIVPQIIGLLIVGYALYDLLARLEIKIPGEVGLYALFGLWAAFTHYIGPRAGEGFTPGLGTLFKVVVATLACAQLIKTDADLFMALKIFVFSILVIYYQNRGDIAFLRMAGQVSEEDRFAGTLNNANTAAIFALTIIWAAILLWLRSKRAGSWGLLYTPPIAISLVIIYYSGSKKGLIGLALLVLFVTRLLYKRKAETPLRKGLVVLISAAMIIIAGYFIYMSPFFFRMQQLFAGISNISDANRLELAREAVGVWLMNARTFFFGVGYENFRTYSVLQTYAHSTPLELLASTGIIGCSLFLGFCGMLFMKFKRLYGAATDAETKSLYFAIEIFLFIYTFFMITAVLHDSKDLTPVLGCLAGYGGYQLRRIGQARQGVIEAADGPDHAAPAAPDAMKRGR